MIFLLEYLFQLGHLEFESLTLGSERCGVDELCSQLLDVFLKFDDSFRFWSLSVSTIGESIGGSGDLEIGVNTNGDSGG